MFFKLNYSYLSLQILSFKYEAAFSIPPFLLQSTTGLQGANPVSDHVFPGTHNALQTVSEVAVHSVATPAFLQSVH